ncbi:hypothetical protein Htur_1146 [Haloterrigena turkmenica DSM 5511]|uniref:Uncharacterized protein n=2 Tax=Haloterrigena turkmenica TaxID=62320 RepID=D2RZB4_HALTV|nr:hypothetical protein Htur_1146 [Haloterrigena turkmenica DSM 5511]
MLVKGALELVDDVETYYDTGRGVITAKTGFRLGFIASSYGESITIDIRSVGEGVTEITATGEKNVAVNVGANPEKYVLEFVRTLDTLVEYPMEDVISLLDERTSDHSKEVASPTDHQDGSAVLAMIVLAIFLLFGLSIIAI